MNHSAVLAFSLLLTVISRGNLYSLCTLNQSFSLEEEDLVIRYTCSGEYYSWYFSEFFDSKNKKGAADFSFGSDKIKAGRLEKEGLWRELFNPFGYTADSELYAAHTGMYNDFTKKKGGLYGVSLSLADGFDISLSVSPMLWAGADLKVVERGGSSFTCYALISGTSYPGTDEWIGSFSELYVSKPAFAGGEFVFAGEKAGIKLAAFISGNRYYRPDVFSRVHFTAPLGNFFLSALAVYAGRDFTMPGGEPVSDRLLLSSSLGYKGEYGFSARIRGTYKSGQTTAYPSVCTGQQGELLFTGEWEKEFLELSCSASLKDEFEYSGAEERLYNFNAFAKTQFPPAKIKLSCGESGEFEGAEKRWVKAEAGISWDRVSADLDLELTKDINGSCFVLAEAGGSVVFDMSSGSFNISAKIRACDPFKGLVPVLTGLSIGFINRTEF